jgi:trimeric autotransporter adhesin
MMPSPRFFGWPRQLAAGTALLTTLVACHDGAVDPLAAGSGMTATLGFQAQVVATGAAGQLRVTSSYVRIGGARVPLDVQSASLSDEREQSVPVTIDLGRCLQDPQRQSGTAPASSDDCLVQLDVDLLVNGATVDRQTVGPLSLRGGQTQTIGQAITLREIGEVRLRAGADSGSTRLEVGRSVPLTASLLDGAQRPVSGRTIDWSSSAPNVATVSATGLVTGVSAGTARITASSGGRSGEFEVRVVLPPQTLRIIAGGTSGTGTVRSVPVGIDCTVTGQSVSGACVVDFPSDVTVELVTTAASGTEFLGWAGSCGGTTGLLCRIAMEQPVITGPVLRALGSITVTAAGTGTGLVTSDLGGIGCQVAVGVVGGTCSATYVQGTVVTLRAFPSGLSAFTGWTGACSGSGPTCTVEVNAARTVTARFDLQVSVGVQGGGLGSGTITSSPAGISCTLTGSTPSGTCTALFSEGTAVTLTAAGASNNTLRRWGGDCATATGNSCLLTATGVSRTAIAQFEPPASIIVAPTGTGGGVVTGGLLNCQRANGSNTGSCSTSVVAGATVTLTATAQSGSEFAGWSGACSGSTAATCTFVAERSTLVTPAFRSLAAVLTVQADPASAGTGYVYTSDEELTCELTATSATGTCSLTGVAGTSITVSAFPDELSTFAGWGGVCSGASLDCTFTLSGGTNTVLARFDPLPTAQITVQLDGPAPGSIQLNAANLFRSCSHAGQQTTTTCTWVIPQGLAFTVSLAPAAIGAGGAYTSITGQLCSTVSVGLQCTVPTGVTQPGILGASFFFP